MSLSSFTQLLTEFTDSLSPQTADKLRDLLAEADTLARDDQAAHMGSESTEDALIGLLLAGLHQGNLLSREQFPVLAGIESALLARLASLFDQSHAIFTHGGTESNLQALWMAKAQQDRHSSLQVYTSDQCHYSVSKACQILGLELTYLPSTATQQIDLAALAKACQQQPPLAVILQFGTTRSGQIDPITETLAVLAPYPSCWLHIDAAWGGFLKCLPDKAVTHDFSQVDSVSFDPHKSLNLPRASGVLMTRHAFKQSSFKADYLHHLPTETVSGSYGGEVFLPLWLTLQETHFSALQERLRQRLKQAANFAALLRTADPAGWCQCSPTGIVCFRPGNGADLNALCAAGVISQTQLDQQCTYRAVFSRNTVNADALFKRLAPYL